MPSPYLRIVEKSSLDKVNHQKYSCSGQKRCIELGTAKVNFRSPESFCMK